LLKPVIDGHPDVVFGQDLLVELLIVFCFLHTIGNKLLTFLSNIFIKLNLSDMETCCKLFNAKMMQSINLQERRFEFEPEFTAKIKGTTIYEVGISY
jgi:hypothetical protein